MVSVLVPTRGRVHHIQRLLASAYSTAHHPFEMIFRADDDDRITINYLAQRGQHLITGPRGRGYADIASFYNAMMVQAHGDTIMIGNDDMVFETDYWPRAIELYTTQYPDQIYCIGTESGLNAEFFTFPIVSRRLLDVIGGIDPRIIFIDLYLRDICRALGRAIRVHAISIRHNWQGREPDQTALDARRSEQEVAYIDERGTWKPEYALLHRLLVNQSIERIREARHGKSD